MSHLLLPLIDCPTLQANLNAVNACKNYPNEDLALINFLTSPLNTNRILEQSVSPGEGKLRTVQLIYTPRVGEGEIETTLTTGCTADDDAGHNSTTYTIDPTQGVEFGEKFNFADLATICQKNPDYIAERVQAMIDGATRKMETIASQQAVLLTGNFVADGDTGLSELNTLKTIATLDADDKFTEDAIQEIVYSAKNSGFCNVPFVFGYGPIWKYMQKTKAVCCANSGIDFTQFMAQNQAMFFSTYRIPSAFGNANDFMVLDAGSLFLLQYNKFANGSGLNAENSFNKMGTIVDPKTGVEFNIKTNLACAGEELHIIISTSFKVVGLPDDMYSAGDRFVGTNGVLHFRVDNS